MQLDELLHRVDPAASSGDHPDGEPLLGEILKTPIRRRSRRRPRAPRIALVTVVCLLASVLPFVFAPSTPHDTLAAAYATVSQPQTILHYRQRFSTRASATEPAQVLGTGETWQASDGLPLRTLETFGASKVERVASATGSKTWAKGSKWIVAYDRDEPSPPAPGMAGIPGRIKDPATLLRRARSSRDVEELGAATVRGIPVLAYRIGRCRTGRTNVVDRTIFTSIAPIFVVSIRRQRPVPVRVEVLTCPAARGPQLPTMTIDYLEFEVLPATNANRRLLELSSHPGVPIIDGAAIDAAEAREEPRPAPTPTPRTTP